MILNITASSLESFLKLNMTICTLYILLQQHQPNNSYHHEDNSQNADADEDDIAQIVRLSVLMPDVVSTAVVSLQGLLLQEALLCRNDGHWCYLPQGIALHLVLLHILLLPVREIDVELVHQHGDVPVFLQGIGSYSLNTTLSLS